MFRCHGFACLNHTCLSFYLGGLSIYLHLDYIRSRIPARRCTAALFTMMGTQSANNANGPAAGVNVLGVPECGFFMVRAHTVCSIYSITSNIFCHVCVTRVKLVSKFFHGLHFFHMHVCTARISMTGKATPAILQTINTWQKCRYFFFFNPRISQGKAAGAEIVLVSTECVNQRQRTLCCFFPGRGTMEMLYGPIFHAVYSGPLDGPFVYTMELCNLTLLVLPF